MKTFLKEFDSYPEASRAVYGTASAVIPASRAVRERYRDSAWSSSPNVTGVLGGLGVSTSGLGLASDAEKFTLPLVWR